nr:response regulator [Skermanella pratensis]
MNPGEGGDDAEEAQGLGLGLAIVRRLAGLLGHPVSVTSTPGRGSRFSVEVPLVASAAPATPAPPVSEHPRGRGLALVLDDEPVILIGLRMLLESWGYQVLPARKPDDALRRMPDTGVPDLIIADYRLGDGVKGPDAIRKLRAALGAEIPGVILTGDTTRELLDEVERGGFDLLHKPVASHELRRKLEGLCRPA